MAPANTCSCLLPISKMPFRISFKFSTGKVRLKEVKQKKMEHVVLYSAVCSLRLNCYIQLYNKLRRDRKYGPCISPLVNMVAVYAL